MWPLLSSLSCWIGPFGPTALDQRSRPLPGALSSLGGAFAQRPNPPLDGRRCDQADTDRLFRASRGRGRSRRPFEAQNDSAFGTTLSACQVRRRRGCRRCRHERSRSSTSRAKVFWMGIVPIRAPHREPGRRGVSVALDALQRPRTETPTGLPGMSPSSRHSSSEASLFWAMACGVAATVPPSRRLPAVDGLVSSAPVLERKSSPLRIRSPMSTVAVLGISPDLTRCAIASKLKGPRTSPVGRVTMYVRSSM